jgi:hypothetical protein
MNQENSTPPVVESVQGSSRDLAEFSRRREVRFYGQGSTITLFYRPVLGWNLLAGGESGAW